MSRSIKPTNYSRPAPTPVTYRVEKCANMLVYIPVKESK